MIDMSCISDQVTQKPKSEVLVGSHQRSCVSFCAYWLFARRRRSSWLSGDAALLATRRISRWRDPTRIRFRSRTSEFPA